MTYLIDVDGAVCKRHVNQMISCGDQQGGENNA